MACPVNDTTRFRDEVDSPENQKLLVLNAKELSIDNETPALFEAENNPLSTSLEYFKANKMTEADLSMKFEYLIDDFMVAQSIMMIFAKGGAGKSFFTLALVLHLLKSDLIKNCIYMDMDNSTMALKHRNLDEIINNYPNLQYIHRSKADKSAKDMITMAAEEAFGNEDIFKGQLFVIDSVRDFMGGKDMNSDRDVAPLMEQLKVIRDAGATIIFLHHSKKNSEGNEYKGSSSFIDSIDVAYGLSKSVVTANTVAFALTVEKDRIPVENTGFQLNTLTMELTPDNYASASMDESETVFVSKVKAALQATPTGIKQGDLLAAIGTSSDDRTARKRLQKFDETMWISVKKPEMGNATMYYPFTDDVPKLPELPNP